MAHKWTRAKKHLQQADPILWEVIDQVGACKLRPETDYFSTLVRSIIAQQISTRAAQSITQKFERVCGEQGYLPERVLELTEEQFREAGLSKNKQASLKSLANHFLAYPHLETEMPAMTDEEIIANLTQVRGIGVWTAQMFLMFSLNRPDVFPVGDLAIQRGMRELYRLKSHVGVSRLEKIAESWRPFRTVACWYIWEVSDQKS